MSHRRVEMRLPGCLWRVNGGLGLFVRRPWEPDGRPDGPKGRIFDRGASDEGVRARVRRGGEPPGTPVVGQAWTLSA